MPEEKSMQQGNTKERIVEAYIELESERPVEKITVTALVERSRITRKTFYYYFKDIYDLLEWIFTNEVIEEIDNEKEEDWQQKFIYIFEYVIQNKEFIKNVYSSGSKEYFLKFVYKQTNLLIINFIEKEYKNKKVKEENKKFIANFYKYGFVGIMEEWIETGMKENPKEIVSKLNDIIEGDIERALEKLSKEK